MINKLLYNWKLLLILFLGGFLIFYSLGDRTLGHDEVDNVKFGRNINTCGFPYNTPCTNNTTFNLSNAPNLFPRLTYYVAYPMILLPGDFEFNLRFPFAFIGLLSIIAFYFLSLELLGDKKYSLLSSFLYAASVVFLLHARSSRYYSLIFLLGILAYLSWYKLIKTGKFQILSIFSLILLFYTHIQIFFYVAFPLFIYGIYKRKFWLTLKQFAIVGLIASPAIYLWLFEWNIPSRNNMMHIFLDPSSLLITFGITFFYLFAFFIPLLLLFFFPRKTEERNYVIFLIISITILMSLVTHNTLPELRKYTSAILPLSTLFVTMCLQRIQKISSLLSLVVLILLVFSNLLQILPLLPIKIIKNDLAINSNINLISEDSKSFLDSTLKIRTIFLEFIYELQHHYVTDIENILIYKQYLENKTAYSEIKSDDIWAYVPNSKIVNSPVEADIIISKQPLNGTKIINIINISKDIWSDAPDIPRHRFKTNNSGIVYISEKI